MLSLFLPVDVCAGSGPVSDGVNMSSQDKEKSATLRLSHVFTPPQPFLSHPVPSAGDRNRLPTNRPSHFLVEAWRRFFLGVAVCLSVPSLVDVFLLVWVLNRFRLAFFTSAENKLFRLFTIGTKPQPLCQ